MRDSDSEEFFVEWVRQPAADLAESVIRLRRLRGMSQAELATLVGTKQPAIARLESGRTNPSLSKLVQIAKALDASVGISMAPLEYIAMRPARSWWEPEEIQPSANLQYEISVGYELPPPPSYFEHEAVVRYASFKETPSHFLMSADSSALVQGAMRLVTDENDAGIAA